MESKEIIVKFCPILVCLSMHPFVLKEGIGVVSQACPCFCELSISQRQWKSWERALMDSLRKKGFRLKHIRMGKIFA